MWPIYSIFARGLHALSPTSVALALALCLALAMTSWAMATGWGEKGATDRWQIMSLSVISFLLAGILTLILGGAAAWTCAAYLISSHGAPEQAAAWWAYQAATYNRSLFIGGGLGLFLGVASFWVVRRYLQPKIVEKLGICVTKDELTDARTIGQHLPSAINYDPQDYFPAAEQANSMFLGLDERRKPVYLERKRWKKTHVQVCGPTGTGKGVMACVCLAQSIAYGDGVFIIDPKNDEWAPSVLAEACQRAGRPFHLVNLRRGQPAQFDMLAEMDKEALNSLFIAGFSLGTKGTDADFYRKNDRAAARVLASLADQGHVSLASLARSAAAALPEDLADKCEGFRRSLEEIAELEAPQAPEGTGPDIAGPIRDGGCLYVIGDMDDEAVVILQKMLLVRMIQLVSARPRDGQQRHITVFADELRYLNSKKMGDTLGSVRDKGCNLILAHQSLDDLQAGDLPSPAVVIDNTGLRWLYRSTCADMAQWVCGQTGTILVGRESRTTETNMAGAEQGQTQRTVMQVERAKIDQNMVQHLPDGVAVVIGAGPARLAFACPVPVECKLDSAALVVPAQGAPAPTPETPTEEADPFADPDPMPCDLEDMED